MHKTLPPCPPPAGKPYSEAGLELTSDPFAFTAKFGANAILGVSLAVCKAGAAEKGVPLYRHIADLAGNKELILPVPVSGPEGGGRGGGPAASAHGALARQELLGVSLGAGRLPKS